MTDSNLEDLFYIHIQACEGCKQFSNLRFSSDDPNQTCFHCQRTLCSKCSIAYGLWAYRKYKCKSCFRENPDSPLRQMEGTEFYK
jgi:hypothetical protein